MVERPLGGLGAVEADKEIDMRLWVGIKITILLHYYKIDFHM